MIICPPAKAAATARRSQQSRRTFLMCDERLLPIAPRLRHDHRSLRIPTVSANTALRRGRRRSVCGTNVLVRNDGIVMTEVQFSLSGHRISRPGLDGAPPQSPRGIHRSRGPVMSSPIRPGKVTWPRAPSRSRHFPTPSGPTAQTRSPPPPRRSPRRPESLREVRSRLQPTVHVHTAAHDHGLVVVDPLDLFHRQHVRPRGPPRTDRPRWFGRSHQLTRARSRRRPAPAGAESSMATLCPWLHNAASAQLPVGLNGP